MPTQDRSNDQQRPGSGSSVAEAKGGSRRLLLLISLLALALFALAYDYKVARPAVEQAYDRIAVANEEINNAAEHRRMTSVDVQKTLKRGPSETFPLGRFTIEAYRWNAGLPIELRGLSGDESPGIGLKTHDYFAVYRTDGAELAFVTHFKFDLDQEFFEDKPTIVSSEGASTEDAASAPGGFGGGPGMGGPDGPGGGGPGGPGGGPGGGGFDPEAMFAERDADADGKLTGEEIPERMRERLEAIDTDKDGSVSKEELLARMSQFGGRGGPGGGAAGGDGEGRRQRPPLEPSEESPAAAAESSDAAPPAAPQEVPAEPATEEKPAGEPATEATPPASEETAKEESGSES